MFSRGSRGTNVTIRPLELLRLKDRKKVIRSIKDPSLILSNVAVMNLTTFFVCFCLF